MLSLHKVAACPGWALAFRSTVPPRDLMMRNGVGASLGSSSGVSCNFGGEQIWKSILLSSNLKLLILSKARLLCCFPYLSFSLVDAISCDIPKRSVSLSPINVQYLTDLIWLCSWDPVEGAKAYRMSATGVTTADVLNRLWSSEQSADHHKVVKVSSKDSLGASYSHYNH